MEQVCIAHQVPMSKDILHTWQSVERSAIRYLTKKTPMDNLATIIIITELKKFDEQIIITELISEIKQI